MKRGFTLLFMILILTASLLSGCQPQEQPLYVMLMWHQHQPYYAPDESGVFTRPWARVHATKDYYDMAAILKDYPKVHVTFNLTPVLIRQLDELAAGAKDNYWVLAEKPAAELTDDEKRFILLRFFDANWDNIVGRFPRYKELLDKRGGSDDAAIEAALTSFDEQDFRDLQVWFNLAWFDPDFLAEEPLKSLVDKGRDFSEADKVVIFDKAREVITAVIPLHKELQDKGQIEVAITPYAHPILPLIYNSDLAAIGDPAAELPERFSYPPDVVAHLTRAAEVYQAHYDRQQRGLWPGEGAVAQDIVKMVAEAGFTWMASGEHVLAKSLGMDGFTRDSQEVVQEADALYRPYYVRYQDGPQVAVFFRDLRLSDLLGFEYSNWDGGQAADDLIARLQAIKARLDGEGAEGPHVVSIILDGENAWEYYSNDGKAFLHALYDRLGNTPGIQTVTPSEYIKKFPQQREIEDLWPGAWFSSDYGTWIGEPEETQAWTLLGKTREMLAAYDLFKRKTAPPEALSEALDWMYLAEGSDWFWWYGADQDSGQDEYFDGIFRALQKKVYETLGEPVPDDLEVPIIPAEAVPPTRGMTGAISPTIDGQTDPADEWDAAGYYEVRGGAQARAEDVVTALYYGHDAKNLYFRLDARQTWADLGGPVYAGLYLSLPSAEATSPFSRLGATTEPKTLLGFQASHLAEVKISGEQAEASLFTADQVGDWTAPQTLETVAVADKVLEWAVPFELLGDVEPGDILNLVAVVSLGERDVQSVPDAGPVQVVISDLGTTTVVLAVDDPAGDDHGPGSYTYPTDGVFESQVFDLQQFVVGYDKKNLVLKFKMFGPINNVWGSPINLSVQTFDVYIDTDPGAGTGARPLLEGRNAALTEGNGWDYAIWVEGWYQTVIRPDAQGRPQDMSGVGMKVIVDSALQQVTIRVPLSAFGEGADPTKWGYAAAVLSQDGFPSAGVRRVRDIQSTAEQWRAGGAPNDTNHTRIFDLAWPEGASPTQEETLGTYPASQEKNMDALDQDDFAQVQLLES
jgi:alpha-amylase/alpha-mannosidase (GH57 family)